MKKVFANRMVAHVWAQQNQPAGRSGNGQFYFEDVTIYSYGSHFPIATFTTDAHGNRCVLVTTDTYGNTTRRHCSHVDNALRGLSVQTWDVANVRSSGNGKPNEFTHIDNVAAMARNAADRAAELAKPRKRARWHDDGHQDEPQFRQGLLEEVVARIVSYCDAFAVDVPANVTLVSWQNNIVDAFAKYNNPTAVAKRVKDAAKRKLKRECEEAVTYQRFHAWREGVIPVLTYAEYSSLGQRDAYDYRQEMYRREPDNARNRPQAYITAEQWCNGVKGELQHNYVGGERTLVRRNGDKLETSRGADCPFAHAVLAFMKAQQCRREGKSWHSNGEQVRVGHFKVDSIDASGNIRAGCHSLQYEEMLRLAVREIPDKVRAIFAVPTIYSQHYGALDERVYELQD